MHQILASSLLIFLVGGRKSFELPCVLLSSEKVGKQAEIGKKSSIKIVGYDYPTVRFLALSKTWDANIGRVLGKICPEKVFAPVF